MGPKKVKARPAEEDIIPQWQIDIQEGILDDETWNVKVFVIDTAETEADRIYLSKFEMFTAQEKRYVIKNVSKTETIFMINQLGADKKSKDDSLLVFEEAERYLREKVDVPTEVFALIIKQLILKMKEEYLFVRRAKLEVKEGLRRESGTMLAKEEVKGAVSLKRQGTRSALHRSPTNTELGDSPKPVDGKKYNTNLRLRGEEWRDKEYVDDYPEDGPNIYVAVSGFQNATLIECLVKIGVPVCAVVKISINPSETEIPKTLNPPTKRGMSQTELFADQNIRFWDSMHRIRLHKDTTDLFKNTAFIIFSPPYWSVDPLSGSPEKIYDEMCYLMFDVQDLTRQHKHYLENMTVIDVPLEEDNNDLNKIYKKKINSIPLECVTMFSIMNTILETVCKEENNDKYEYESGSSGTLPRQSSEDAKVYKAKTLIRHVFNTLCKSDCDKSYRVTYGEEYENQKDPIVIMYGNFAKYKTFHLGDLKQSIKSTLFSMPINKLWLDRDLPSKEMEEKLDFHYRILISCIDRDDLDSDEVNRLLHILACRKLYNNRSCIKRYHLPGSTIEDFKKTYLKRTKLAEPLPVLKKRKASHPSPEVNKSLTIINSSEATIDTDGMSPIFQCPELTELVSAAEIAAQMPVSHLIDNFEYFEDFEGTCALQVVHDAYNSYNCVDYTYCAVTDTIILMFYNSHDNDGISCNEWRSHLVSPVCLHDFFDFVLEEEYEWIKNEEKIYDEAVKLRSISLLKDSMEVLVKSCIENTDIATELLMEGSLKHQDHSKIIEEQTMTEVAPSTTAVSEKTDKSEKTAVAESEKTSMRKSPKGRKGQKTSIRDSEVKEESEQALIEEYKRFTGFDIGDRRVEVFCKDATYFSHDGTKVFSSYMLLIPSNLEYVSLNVVPGVTKHEFWFHKALGEYASSAALESSDSFTITTKDQIIIHIKKQVFSVPIIDLDELPTTRSKQTSTPTVEESETLYETQSYYSFIKTWPNGMVTESVYNENSNKISHIKQYYTQPILNLKEEKRCISLNGEVIIFKANQEIEVLKPDGTYILITKVGKKRVITDDESINRGTTENLSKTKFQKPPSSSKLAKKHNEDDEKEQLNAIFEIHLKEFEIIEPNGLKQKWIDDAGVDVEKLIIRTATDFCIGEVFTRRMDGTNTLLNSDGQLVVTFPNNTRIITTYVIEEDEIFPEWTEEEIEYLQMMAEATKPEFDPISDENSVGTGGAGSIYSTQEEEETPQTYSCNGFVSIQLIYTVEHTNFATININNSEGAITVSSPKDVSLTVNMENKYDIFLDKLTKADFDGNNLQITYEACTECGSYTTCEISVCNEGEVSSEKELDNTSKIWLKLKDSLNKKVFVSEEGAITTCEDTISQEITQESGIVANINDNKPAFKSDSIVASHGKCKYFYKNRSLRFIQLRRDLTCSELVHSDLVDEYKRKCRWQPWCSVTEHDTFGEYRKLHSIILPLNLTESEKWIMNSKLADKPKYLTFKDLKKDEGKGFYHWMRPYARFTPQPQKPINVPPPRQPRAFVLRTLEKQWSEAKREELCGAKEMVTAILRYRKALEADSETLLSIPSKDFRTETEQTADRNIHELANKILLEDLKKRLKDDLEASIQPSITTKPPPPPPAPEYEEEMVFDEMTDMTVEEESITNVQQLNEFEEISPELAKYWKQRAEEYKEEQMYRQLLREGLVPPYFQNVLGGAIWWEANNLATVAVQQAEQQRLRCSCAAEAEEQTRDNTARGKKRWESHGEDTE